MRLKELPTTDDLGGQNTRPSFGVDFYDDLIFLPAIYKTIQQEISDNFPKNQPQEQKIKITHGYKRKESQTVADAPNSQVNHDLKALFDQLATMPQAVQDKARDYLERLFQSANSTEQQADKGRLILPNDPPIKWANRETFLIDEVKDAFTRQRFETENELEGKIRACKSPNDALAFLDLVYGPFIKAGVMFQADLRKLDYTLFTYASPLYRERTGHTLSAYLKDPRRAKIEKTIEKMPPLENVSPEELVAVANALHYKATHTVNAP